MTVMPGAVWRPIPVSATRPRRSKGRAVVFHVAESEATSLFGFFFTASVDSHFYVARDGTIEQYVDTDLQAYASMTANASTISVETQGGVTNPDGEPWTDAQVQSLARIARWAHDSEGVPLQLMPDSLPASRGIGFHRLGINPWRVAGGEVWSASRGKVCPGAAKIAQVPQVISLAQGNPGGDGMALTDQDLVNIYNTVWFGHPGAALIPREREGGGEWPASTLGSMTARVARDIVNPAAQAVLQKLNAQLDPQAVADDILAKLPADQAQAVASLVLAGLNGAQINVNQPTA